VGNTKRAQEAFLRALSFNVVLPRSSLELAQLAYDDGDYPAATSYYDTFRSRAQQTPASLCLGIRLAQVAGNSNQMASYQMALRNLYPKSTETRSCIQEG
jgi:type IV pilus assembly protein PilF